MTTPPAPHRSPSRLSRLRPGARRDPLRGRTVVVTGAASGMGRELSRRLSRDGCPVVLADVDTAGLAGTVEGLRGPVRTVELDVADAAAVREFATAVARWAPAPIGAVFNNAGVAVTGSVLEGSADDDEWLRRIDFDGVVNGTRAFLPLLVAQGSGTIVNTSSVYGLAAVPFHSAYCAAKFAVRGFTESLRHELAGTGVRAVVVHPGGVRTEIARRSRTSSEPDDRGLSPEERAAEFEALAMTGADRAARIIVDGVERGRSRILVGPDARFFDLATRLTPNHYMALVGALESALARFGGPPVPATAPAPSARQESNR
ncbi:SDR family NAD(P)-dependent oxidoreductase [Pseudonocardia alni]|uniref:SDR family NAD(P)-dependent oxidoreductase n=1 Tax=Pseudonocardia alni TaxID=33907 RepID=UPI0033F777C7